MERRWHLPTFWCGACTTLARLYGVHGSTRGEAFILVTQFGYLEKGINPIAFEAVYFQASSPIF